MKFTPRAHQREAIAFLLAHPAAALWMRVGAGKTATLLEAFRYLRAKDQARRLLVLAPLRVCHYVWPDEVAKWLQFRGLSVAVAHGSTELRHKAFAAKADVTMMNYEGLPWLAENAHHYELPDMIVADESTKLKDTRTQRFKALKPLLPHFRRRVGLTGTPAPNGLEDLFGQIYFLDEGERLGRTVTRYRMSYFTQHPYKTYEWTLRPGAEAVIYEKLGDLVLRQPDPKGLPELVVQDVMIDLPPAARRVYDELERQFFVELEEGTITAANAAVKSQKLRQVVQGFLYQEQGGASHLHEAKCEALADLFEQLGGEPALVAYVFRRDAEVLEAEFGIPTLSGASPARGRELIDAWNRRELGALALHPASAGHGLNLQAGGRDLIFYGLDWDLGLVDQTIGRLHRTGQKETVYVHRILGLGTVEELVAQALAAKGQTQEALLDALRRRGRGDSEAATASGRDAGKPRRAAAGG